MSSNKLLFIASDPDVTAMLDIYFESAGYTVKTFQSSQNGILEARSWKPDAILVDARIKDKAVSEVCQDLLTHSLTNHIPIVLLLDSTDRRAKLEALEIGVDDIVGRPFDVEELKLRVEAVIRLASYRSSIPED